MSADDLQLAKQFVDALAAAARTGDRDGLYPFLAHDMEWLTPKRDIHGLDEARDQLTWIRPPDHLDVEFHEPDITDLGGGRFVSEVHEIYRMKETGEFAYARARRIELTVRAGKIAKCEMRLAG
jgi:ketosteroid isomerase-like protein